MKIIAFAIAASLAGQMCATNPGLAASDAGCAGFKWPVEAEQALFLVPHPASATAWNASAGPSAITAQLAPAGQLTFAMQPEHNPGPGTYAAAIALTGLAADGLYQITLSDEAWLDVIQDDIRLKSAEFSGSKGCPGVRKLVRFSLKAGSAILQISGAKQPQLDVAVSPVN